MSELVSLNESFVHHGPSRTYYDFYSHSIFEGSSGFAEGVIWDHNHAFGGAGGAESENDSISSLN